MTINGHEALPEEPELSLTQDGWMINGGSFDHVMIKVATVVKLSPDSKDKILLQTKRMCAELTMMAKDKNTPAMTKMRALIVRDELRQEIKEVEKGETDAGNEGD